MLTEEEVWNIAMAHYPYFVKELHFQLARRKFLPDLLFRKQEETFTNLKTIIIGFLMFFYKDCKNPEEVDAITYYLIMHEKQHLISTPDKAWMYGITTGAIRLGQELSNLIEGKGFRQIRNIRQLDTFCEEAKKKGYFFTSHQLQAICHSVQNALEDGRIERIAAKDPLFRGAMATYRGRFWLFQKTPEDVTPTGIFQALLLQILVLATVGRSASGFYEVFRTDKTLLDFVENKLLIKVALGVYSKNCKQCMDHAIELECLLAPYLLAATKNSEDFTKSMKDKEESLDRSPKRGVSSSEEEEDDDEEARNTYKALKKEEEQAQKNVKTTESVSKEEEKEEGETSPSISMGSSDEEGLKNEEGTPNAHENEVNSFGSETKKQGESREIKQQDFAKTKTSKAISALLNQGLGNRLSVGRTASLVEDPKEMEKIVSETLKLQEETLRAINESAKESVTANDMKEKTVENVDNTMQASDALRGLYDSMNDSVTYQEVRRDYDLCDHLPSDLEAEAKLAKKDVDKLFTKQKAPELRHRSAGILDARDVYRLAINDYNVFSKKSPSKQKERAIYLLLDRSGSMGAGKFSKFYYGCKSLAVLEECFKDRCALKIAAFDACGSNYVTHCIIKGWKERNSKNLSYNFYTHRSSGSGNKDGYSIRLATEDLLARPEEEKLLIVLSDGAPTCYRERGQGEQDVRGAVKSARKKGVKVASIFFGDGYESEGVRAMYEYGLVATTPEHITEELFKIVKQLFV